MADKKTQLMAQFYEQCQEKGYTDMHNDTQSLKAKVIATDLKLNYGDIVAFYEKAKQCYEKVQKEQAEEDRQQRIKKQREEEEAKRRAVDGVLLAEISDCHDINKWKATVLRVYIRPDNTVYTTVNGGGKKIEEAPTFAVQNGEYMLYKYHPSKAVYTSVTVGGITTGGVHYTQDGYSYDSLKTGNADVHVSIDAIGFNAAVIILSEYARERFHRDPEFLSLVKRGQIACRKNVDVSDTLRAVFSSASYETQMFAISKAADDQRLDSKLCARIVTLAGHIVNGYFPPSDEEIYAMAEDLALGTTSEQLKHAVETFRSISDYKDASQRAHETNKKYDEVLQQEKEQRIIRNERQKKKHKKIVLITVPVVLLIMITLFALLHFIGMNRAEMLADEQKFLQGRNAIIVEFSAKLQDPNLISYLDAGVLLEKGQFDDAKEAFDALGNYRDSESLSTKNWYLSAKQLAEENKYEDAVAELEKLAKLGFEDSNQVLQETRFDGATFYYNMREYSTALAMVDLLIESGYPGAKTLQQQIRLATAEEQIFDEKQFSIALSVIKELVDEGYSPAKIALTDIYSYAKRLYLEGDLVTAKSMFTLLESYDRAADYLTLIDAHEGAAKLSDLWAIRDFENAGELLLQRNYLCEFLVGNWTGNVSGSSYTEDSDSYYFEMTTEAEEHYSCAYNLPWKYRGTFFIENGVYVVTDVYGNTHNSFRFSLKDWNTIEVYCYADRCTYEMYRS